jgi:hypothetical protein
VTPKKKKLLTASMMVVALLATRLVAQEERPAPGHGKGVTEHTVAPEHGGGEGGEHEAADRHGAGPVPPDPHAVWPGAVLIVIAFLFVVAIPVGIFARMHAPPDEPPPAHSHDEPPGASHHHGSGGTVNPEPYHGHASDHH